MEEGGSSGVGKRENQAFTSFQRDLTMSFGGQKELSHVRGQGQRPRVPGCNGAGTAEKSYPSPRSGAAAGRSYPTSEVRGGGRECYRALEARDSGREDQPHIQGAVAARAQEGLEELTHIEGQGAWR